MCMKKVLAAKNGQSLVETALVLPLVILILTGIIDFGLLFKNYIVITNAAREGARSAAVGNDDSEINTLINGASSTLDRTKLKITITPNDSTRKNGDDVSVTVEYDNTLFTPGIAAIIGNPVHLEAKTVMRVE